MAAAVRFHFHYLFLFLLSAALSSFSAPLPENEALLKLKKSFTNSGSLSSWVPDQNPCSSKWEGVICIKKVITSLHLSEKGLSGDIDIDALTQIPSLRSISFVSNNFSGHIPAFNKLGALKAIYLTKNQFSGPIPPDFFSQLASLKKIWLSGNKFSGSIPDSLTKLRFLNELHLEMNEFSGPIPEFKHPINSLDLSNNKLEGPIPAGMEKYNVKSFAGNEGLCGGPLDKKCDEPSTKPSTPTTEPSTPTTEPSTELKKDEGESNWAMKLIMIVVIAGLLGMAFMYMKDRSDDDDDFGLSNDHHHHHHHHQLHQQHQNRSIDEAVQVHVPSSTKSRASSEHGSSKKGAVEAKKSSSRNGMGDLIMLNDEKGVFGLPDLMKAAAEVLGNGGLGSAYKAAMANGLSVVVKRMREMNKVSRDIFDAEMRRFGRLKHNNILTPLAYHYRREEKLFVTEYMPKGSLLYVLHGDRGLSHAELNWPTRLNIVKGIARGLGFLYSEFPTEELPHGNLKSSNVLLTDNYEPLLSDFAFHPLINPNYAIQTMFAYKTPDYVQYQKISQKTDVYCLGIIILEIITGKFPSQYHSNGKGGTDVVQWVFTAICDRREEELIDPELKSNSTSVNQMLQLLQAGAACTESNPEQRLNMKEAIRRIEEVQV